MGCGKFYDRWGEGGGRFKSAVVIGNEEKKR